MSEVSQCPICHTECDITEEDLIDADCGACGSVTIHVHCKEKYCRQQGIPKGQYKGYTCPHCTRAKVSAQHLRQKEKKKKGNDKSGNVKEQHQSGAQGDVDDVLRKKQPIFDARDLVAAVLADSQSDPTVLHPLKAIFKRLLQVHRAFKTEEDLLVSIWKPFATRRIRQHYVDLRDHDQPAYIQATSLLKLTSAIGVDDESEEVQKKRMEVAEQLLGAIDKRVLEALDASHEYGRCQPLYDLIQSGVDTLCRRCETGVAYIERLRKSLPSKLHGEDGSVQDQLWSWSDIESEIEGGAVLCLVNVKNTSDEHQLRCPPFYVSGIPWCVRLYRVKQQANETPFLAAYLDASHALRENADFDKQVTFTFTARRTPDLSGQPTCRKEATFTFKKDTDNRGWRECIALPQNGEAEGRIYLAVEIREGAVATENTTICFKMESHQGVPEARFKWKQSMTMLKLLELFCSRHHLRQDKVSFRVVDRQSGASKSVEADHTPSDLGLQENDSVLVTLKDSEVDAVMKKAQVGMLEAAEALEKCAFQPRKALANIASTQQAKAKVEAAKKAQESEAKSAPPVEAKKKTFSENQLSVSNNYSSVAKPAKSSQSNTIQEENGSSQGRGSSSQDEEEDSWSKDEDARKARRDEDMKLFRLGGPDAVRAARAARDSGAEPPESWEQSVGSPPWNEDGGDTFEGFEEVKGKKKTKKRGDDTFGFESLEITQMTASPMATVNGRAPFGGRKVFIGGTADKDQEELQVHFAQFGDVASVEVLKERDGSYRGFAFVTFYDVRAAQALLDQHHTYLGGVRMEAKPCVQPRGELELDRKIEAILSTPTSVPTPTRAPVVSAWGAGPPKREDTLEWRQAEQDPSWPAIKDLGDVFDPEKQINQTSTNASQASTVDNSVAAATSGWDTAGSCMDTPMTLGIENMLNFDEEENICSICYDDLANASLKPCGHTFCATCIGRLKKQAVYQATEGVLCPNCRAPVKEFILPNTAKQSSQPTNQPAWGGNTPSAAAAITPVDTWSQPFASAGGGLWGSSLLPTPTPGSLQVPAQALSAWDANLANDAGASGETSMWCSDPIFTGREDSNSLLGGSSLWGSTPVGSNTGAVWDASSWSGPAAAAAAAKPVTTTPAAIPAPVKTADTISIKVKMVDEKEVMAEVRLSDQVRVLKQRINQLTGTPEVAQRLIFQGRVLESNQVLSTCRVANNSVVHCSVRDKENWEDESVEQAEREKAEREEQARRQQEQQQQQQQAREREQQLQRQQEQERLEEQRRQDQLRQQQQQQKQQQQQQLQQQQLQQQQPQRQQQPQQQQRPKESAAPAWNIPNGGSSEDDRHSDDGSHTSSQQGKGYQNDDDWESVVDKKKKKAARNKPNPAPAVGANSVPAAAPGAKGERKHFFGLWVGNVHSEVVDLEELRAAFEQFGELCVFKLHSVPAINVLPDSSSAFVNFCTYEAADAARTALQGKTVAGAGPLKINGSDFMQQYEEQHALAGRRPESAPARAAASAPTTYDSESVAFQAPRGWGAPPPAAYQPVAAAAPGGSLSAEQQRLLDMVEQEKRDRKMAMQLQRQEQYELAHQRYTMEADERKRQAALAAASLERQRQTQAASASSSGFQPTYLEPHSSSPAEAARPAPARTLMDHLPSQLRGGNQEASSAAPAVPDAWGIRKPYAQPVASGWGSDNDSFMAPAMGSGGGAAAPSWGSVAAGRSTRQGTTGGQQQQLGTGFGSSSAANQSMLLNPWGAPDLDAVSTNIWGSGGLGDGFGLSRAVDDQGSGWEMAPSRGSR